MGLVVKRTLAGRASEGRSGEAGSGLRRGEALKVRLEEEDAQYGPSDVEDL